MQVISAEIVPPVSIPYEYGRPIVLVVYSLERVKEAVDRDVLVGREVLSLFSTSLQPSRHRPVVWCRVVSHGQSLPRRCSSITNIARSVVLRITSCPSLRFFHVDRSRVDSSSSLPSSYLSRLYRSDRSTLVCPNFLGTRIVKDSVRYFIVGSTKSCPAPSRSRRPLASR